MPRSEFPANVKDKAYARAASKCELCGGILTIGKFEYDHRLPDALGGKNDLANCMVICTPCHKAKTSKEDVPRIRKADRQRKKHIGAVVEPAIKLKSRGFPPTGKSPRIDKSAIPPLPRRSIYGDV
jgi:5-methylcytosine-specific restriction endonuclease McrA